MHLMLRGYTACDSYGSNSGRSSTNVAEVDCLACLCAVANLGEQCEKRRSDLVASTAVRAALAVRR